RTLQRTRRAGGVNEIAPANRRDVKVGKGKQHVMQNRSIWRSGQPTFPHAWSNAGYDRDLIREGHYGQRSCEPRKQAEHMAAPTNAAYVQESPCQLGAVHTWG